ncbi:MAG: carboxy-S-adenosyl-L-methionine synthase CmoA [Gammaproteobacteria bacterium]
MKTHPDTPTVSTSSASTSSASTAEQQSVHVDSTKAGVFSSHFEQDKLYRNYFNAVPDFCFDENVAAVFPDMIRRSVPGYGTVLEIIRPITLECVRPGDRVYDLGCSVGAGLIAVQQTLHTQHTPSLESASATSELIGIDSSAAMLEKANHLIDAFQSNSPHPLSRITLKKGDITRFPFQPCRLILMNYTLQFIPRPERDALIQKLHDALLPGGRLMLTEKIRYDDAPTAQRLQTLHEHFKLTQGYSALEVAQKREAIDHVLQRETETQHRQRLQNAGFHTCFIPMRCLEFITLVAEKTDT